MSFEVWIRTHSNRLDSAFKLKGKCHSAFPDTPIHILDTGEKSKTYSEKFIMLLHRQLQSCVVPYVLLLEDDMLVRSDISDQWDKFLKGSHCWFSVPSQAVLDNSIKCSDTRYRLEEFQNFSYSGAILLSRTVLKGFVAHYLLDPQRVEAPNFDVNLSAYIKASLGHLTLCPGFFGSDITIPSSIDGSIAQLESRSVVKVTELDPLFDRTNVL